MGPPSSSHDGTGKRLNKWGEMCAGSFAGGVSRFLVAPLDVLKIRFQLQVEPVSKRRLFTPTTGDIIITSSLTPTKQLFTNTTTTTTTLRQTPMYTSMWQAVRALLAEEGIRTLWRGNGAAMLLWMTYMGIQFPMYRAASATAAAHHHVTVVVPEQLPRDDDDDGDRTHINTTASTSSSSSSSRPALLPTMIAGAVAGTGATLLTYPLDWLRTRLASQGIPPQHPTIASLIRHTYTTQGIKGYFQGIFPTLLQIAPSLAVTFASYEQCSAGWRKYVTPFLVSLSTEEGGGGGSVEKNTQSTQTKKQGGKGESGIGKSTETTTTTTSSSSSRSASSQLESLVSGAVAGTLGKIAVYPLDTVKKRLQVEGMQRSAEYGARRDYGGSTWKALTTIAKEEGIFAGLYKGTAPSLLKAGTAAAVTFWSYEAAAQYLRETQGWAVVVSTTTTEVPLSQ